MARNGSNISEMLRMQSRMVVEQTWDRDPNYRRVYVVKVTRGLPKITSRHELIDVKFNVDTYQRAGSDEPAYHLQFKHDAEKYNSDIDIGSYVYMADENDEWKWWMILGLDERPIFRQYHIAECNWEFGWVEDGKIYHHLGILRQGSSMRETDENSHTSVVNGNIVAWMATNEDTQLIDYNQRFLISNHGRKTPLCFGVSNIIDTMPIGITKFVLSQQTFDPAHDNAELMLCNYYDSEIEPSSQNNESDNPDVFIITHNGTKPSIKVGGSEKVFTAQLPENNNFDVMWSFSDGANEYGGSYENGTSVFGDYTVTIEDRVMKLKVSANYELIGAILTIKAKCLDGSHGEVQVEVI
jgi:hypothetical protein